MIWHILKYLNFLLNAAYVPLLLSTILDVDVKNEKWNKAGPLWNNIRRNYDHRQYWIDIVDLDLND